MPVTIKDVAEHANVSISTVSRVLNQSGYVSESTRQRVEDVLEELQYQLNWSARSTRFKESFLVSLVIPDILNAYFATVSQYILEYLRQRGHRLLVQITNEDPKLEMESLMMLQERQVDGIIYVPVVSNKNSAFVRHLAAKGLPMIELSRKRDVDSLEAVLEDNLNGSCTAVQYLLELGHRYVGMINGSKHSSTARDRYLGYKKALEDHGLAIDESLIKMKESSSSWGVEATKALLNNDPKPTALFIASNMILIGALTEMVAQQIRIPEDMSIISFDDPEWMSIWQPPITTVGVAVEEMGELAAQLLLRKMRGERTKQKPVTYNLSVNLIKRYSCTPPRGKAAEGKE